MSINRYVDVPPEVGPFTGAYVPVRASCNGVRFRGTLAPRGGGRCRLGLNAAVRRAAGGVDEGDDVVVTIRRTTPHPIPPMPRDLGDALAQAPDTRARRVRTILDRLGL